MSANNKYQYLQDAGPGLLFGVIHRMQELNQCLISDCDSWVLKVEKVLIHSSFLFGFISPRRVVWEVLKKLMERTSTQLGNLLENPSVESELRMGMSLLEQLGLTYIWDIVRDGSICIRFNNCDNDFMRPISNMKIQTCGVQDWNDDSRKLSTCERLFDDSPLILLAVGMLFLTIFANANINGAAAPPPAANSSNSGNSTGTGTSVQASQTPAAPSSSANGFVSPSFGPSSSNSGTQAPLPKSGSPHQIIQAQCPNCKINFKCTVPNPWKLCCAQISPYNKDGMKKLLQSIKCKECKEKIKKSVNEIIKKKASGKKKSK